MGDDTMFNLGDQTNLDTLGHGLDRTNLDRTHLDRTHMTELPAHGS